MNTRSLLLFTACCLPFLMNGQTVERSITGAGGTSVSLANISIDYTVGDVAIATQSTPGNILTQGYQQPVIAGSGTVAPFSAMGITVYPNPAEKQLYFRIPETKSTVNIEMFNALGQLVKSMVAENTGFTELVQMDISDLAPGFYPLRIAAGGQSAHTVIVKK